MSAEPTPGRRDPEGRRAAMVRAAAEIVVEQGPAALTHRAVAARAGVALGTTTAYFDSIDDLREQGLQSLAAEIDAEIAQVQDALTPLAGATERCVALLHEYLCDERQVRAALALVSAATTDARLRELALRWSDHLIDLLAPHIGTERSLAVVAYVDGATVHAGLYDTPVTREAITRVIKAILTMPTDEQDQS